MREKTIRLTLSEEGIQRAIDELKEYEEWVKSRQKLFVERLAEYGLKELHFQWENGIRYDGLHQERLDCQRTDNGFVLSAEGHAVCFIEFGTGVTYNGSGSYPKELPPGVVGIGEYGHHLGKMSSWRYPRQEGDTNPEDERHPGYAVTQGNPANIPMLLTALNLEDQITIIASEVFR